MCSAGMFTVNIYACDWITHLHLVRVSRNSLSREHRHFKGNAFLMKNINWLGDAELQPEYQSLQKEQRG